MRKALGCLIVLLVAVSVAMTARYGWKQAAEPFDQWLSAIMYGSIALCAVIFDGVAVRLWRRQERKTAVFVGVIASLAFVVSFTNSLGSIAGRADGVMAEREAATDTRADNRRSLEAAESAIATLGAYKPTDAAAVAAAQRAADTAHDRKIAECGKNNETRGPHCRDREADDSAAAVALSTVSTDKTTTDRAHELEAQIKATRTALAASPAVAVANPLASALQSLVGSAGSVLVNRLAALVSLVFELCMVALMVTYATLGHLESEESVGVEPESLPIASDVLNILTENIRGHRTGRIELADLIERYRSVCISRRQRPVEMDVFIEQLRCWCRALGIRLERDEDGLVYLTGVRLTGAPLTVEAIEGDAPITARPPRLGHMARASA